jgi:hypothetical protein
MAVPGRFETTRKIIFALCRTSQIVIARSKDWTGDLSSRFAVFAAMRFANDYQNLFRSSHRFRPSSPGTLS